MEPPPQLKARFDAEVPRLRGEITGHRQAVALAPDRKVRIETLTSLLKRLEALISLLRDRERVLLPLLQHAALPRLGALLSVSGIESLKGSVGWTIHDRAIDDVLERRSRGDVTFMDGLTLSRREGVAAEMGPDLLVQLLLTQSRPVAQALALEKRIRGGRPQHLYRNFVVQELAEVWTDETGKRAPTGKTGPFQDLCARALGELDLSTDGLDDCIRRTVRKLSRSHSATPPQNPS